MSLAFLKREKNFIAVIDKGYPRYPEAEFDYDFLIIRLEEEKTELLDAIRVFQALPAQEHIIDAKKECADISNLVDYIFNKLDSEMIT